jgi:hypothetical protein
MYHKLVQVLFALEHKKLGLLGPYSLARKLGLTSKEVEKRPSKERT